MERRDFLKFACGLAAGSAVLAAAGASAAPLLAPPSLMAGPRPAPELSAQPAVGDQNEVSHLSPEQVQWRHPHWRHRHWRRWHRPWHRRHWRRW